MRKRGQIALFIVVGIVLLIAVSLFLFLQSNTVNQQLQQPIPEPSTPLEVFVSSCIEQTAREGLFTLGIQGGYIELPEEILSNPQLYISSNPLSPIKTPVWWMFGQTLMPSKEQMAQQLEVYVETYLPRCLQNFSAIPDRTITPQTDPDAQISINAKDISIYLEYPLQSTDPDKQAVVDEFGAIIPVQLDTIHDAAQEILLELRSQKFLETVTIDLMALADPEIPMSGITFTCAQPVWQQFAVEQRLEEILTQNIPKIRVQNTNHAPFQEDINTYLDLKDISIKDFEEQFCDQDGCSLPQGTPADQFEFNHLYFDAGLPPTIAQSKINVGFRYDPFFNLAMAVRPSENGILKAAQEQGNGAYLDFLCMNVYHFTYDLVYPVEVTIIQEDAFRNGDDFVMRFAVPVLIQTNQPQETNFGSTLSLPLEYHEEFCLNTQNEETKIIVRDGFIGNNLIDADLQFECLKLKCPLGKTQSELNGVIRKSVNLPAGCIGAKIKASKEGYAQEKININPEQKTVELLLKPLRDMPYRIDLAKVDTLPVPLNKEQTAYITITSTDFNYQQSYVYDPTQQVNSMQILDTPSQYNISVSVYDQNALIGGYIGQMDIDESNIGLLPTIHVYEQLPHPSTGQQIADLFVFLRDDTDYQQDYGVVFQ